MIEINLEPELITLTEIEGQSYRLYGFNQLNEEPVLHFVTEFVRNGKNGKLYKENLIYHSSTKAEPPSIPSKISRQLRRCFLGAVVNAL